MLFLLYIIFVTSYFPLALTAPPSISQVVPFKCSEDRWHRPYKPLDPNDCSTIVRTLRHIAWAKESATWGVNQPGEFETPKWISHGTCEIYIREVDEPTTPPRTDVFRLADYFDTMTVVISTCFQGHGGDPWGNFIVGPRKLFAVDIVPIQDGPDSVFGLMGRNRTMHRIGNGTGYVV